MTTVYVIGISGGTCSGKSTITDMLEETLHNKYKVAVLRMDDYYEWAKMQTIAPITRISYPEHNHPSAVDMDKLNNDFLAAVYNKTNDIVIIEGIFAFYFEHLREKLDLKVFIDLKSDERIYRRIKRMIAHEAIDEIAQRYLDTVRYRHDEFVEPTRWYADIVINGNKDVNVGVDIITSCIESKINKINKKGLHP
ncbi:MAG: deoxynucleoside kinase [Defluviitaleaceae bacterium]|nr:deoxynucleoside kinase [Defluviitaleaceae bacterium]